MAKTLRQGALAARFARVRAALSRGMAAEFLLFAASTLLYQGSRLAVGLVVAAWVGPERFGLWNTLNLLLLYGVLTTLGVPNGMNREVPRLRGQGDEEGARRAADLTLWFSLASSIGGGLLVLVAAFGGPVAAEARTAVAWCALLFAIWQLYQYLQMRLKSMARFQQMSVQQAVFALLLPIVALPLAWEWGVAGYVAGQAFAFAALCLYIWRLDPPGRPSWDWSALRGLAQIGWPIMLAGLLYSLLTSVDRWVILHALGVEALGHYSLAILCLGSLSLFPAIISQQMYPRMAYRYGQTGDPQTLVPMIYRQALVAGGMSLPLLGAAALLLPVVTARWMPAYVPGVVPAQILMAGLAAIALAGAVGNFLNTVGRQQIYLAVQAATIVISLALSLLFVRLGLGLNGVALGAALSYAFFAVALWAACWWQLRR